MEIFCEVCDRYQCRVISNNKFCVLKTNKGNKDTDSQSLIASAYRVDEKVVGNVKAGVSDEIDNKIYNIITEEIMPELNEICQRYNREIPVVFKYTYNLKTGSFDSEYLYAKDVAEDYECGTEALKWIKSR